MGMIPKLELADTTYGLPLQTVCYATSGTYPMRAAYLENKSDGEPYGVPARMLSILFATLVNTRSDDYYPITRKLIIGDDARRLFRRMKTCNGGKGVETFVDSLRRFSRKQVEDKDGVPCFPFEEHPVITPEFWGSHLVFSEQYEAMLRDHPREVPIQAVTMIRGAVRLDLLMIAALYCPDNRVLGISLSDLKRLIPATSKATLGNAELSKSIALLNGIQDEWRFTLTAKHLMIKPLNVLLEGNKAVLLRSKTETGAPAGKP